MGHNKKPPDQSVRGFLENMDPPLVAAGDDEKRGQLHPDVVPQASHFKQVPLRTMVNCPHSRQGSPS